MKTEGLLLFGLVNAQVVLKGILQCLFYVKQTPAVQPLKSPLTQYTTKSVDVLLVLSSYMGLMRFGQIES